MTMPGFTAAASLYKTPCHYIAAANSSLSGAVPQLAAGGGWLDAICRLYCECCGCCSRDYPGCCYVCAYCALIIAWPLRADLA